MGAKQVRKGGSIPGSTLKQDAIFMKHETAVYQYYSQGGNQNSPDPACAALTDTGSSWT